MLTGDTGGSLLPNWQAPAITVSEEEVDVSLSETLKRSEARSLAGTPSLTGKTASPMSPPSHKVQ